MGLEGLDSHSEIGGGLRTGVRVEVIGSAVVELVPAAELVAQINAERGHSHAHGEPSDDPQCLALAYFFGRDFRASARVDGVSFSGSVDIGSKAPAGMIAQFRWRCSSVWDGFMMIRLHRIVVAGKQT